MDFSFAGSEHSTLGGESHHTLLTNDFIGSFTAAAETASVISRNPFLLLRAVKDPFPQACK